MLIFKHLLIFLFSIVGNSSVTRNKAVFWYKRLLDFDSSNEIFCYEYASLLYSLGDYNEALLFLDKVSNSDAEKLKNEITQIMNNNNK